MKTIKYIITFTLCSIIFFQASAEEYLDNTVIVRFKYFYMEKEKLNSIMKDEKIEIQRRALPIEASVRLNTEKLAAAMSNKNFDRILQTEEPLLRTYIVKYDGDIDPHKYCYYLRKKYPEIELAEPYRLAEIQAFTPNDPFIHSQDELLSAVKAYDAWEIEKGNPDVTIGISDNGVYKRHEDLRDNINVNESDPVNGIDDDENGYIDDYDGYNFDGGREPGDYAETRTSDNHGTVAAGIAAADFNNGIGVAGIAGNSTLFPIRIGSKEVNESTTVYGYESMIFAAIKGFDVLNCSWGKRKTYSVLEQSIVDYAIAKDVVIVASAGNIQGSDPRDSKFFPAGYKGVLGVGVVSPYDRLSSNSSLGSHCRIMSPASGNYTTDNNNQYTNVSDVTSFSAPVVAGAAALVRSKHPELDAVQTTEFLRQCTDDITDKNTFFNGVLPGRLNLYEAVTKDPFSIPGLVIENKNFFDTDGNEHERFFNGDTVNISFDLNNVLGDAESLELEFSIGYPENLPIELLDSIQTGFSIENNEQKQTDNFTFVINDNITDNVTFRLDISDEDGYHDFLLFDFTPVSTISTFENEQIMFSISDKGTFGYNPGRYYREGVGFILKDFGNALYDGGIFVVENDENVLTSFFGTESEFVSLKSYYEPKNEGIIISTPNISNSKVKIDQTIELPKNSNWVRIIIDLQDSIALGSQYSVGYYFDWDVGIENEYENNFTELMEDAIPSNTPTEKFSAIYTGNPNIDQIFGTAIISNEPDAKAKIAGYTSNTSLNSDLLKSTMSASNINVAEDTSDIFNLIGMRYDNNFEPYESKRCTLIVAAADDTLKLKEALQQGAGGITSVEEDVDHSNLISINENEVSIDTPYFINAEIYRIDGKKLYSTYQRNFEVGFLKTGVYLLKVELKDRFIIKKFSVVY